MAVQCCAKNILQKAVRWETNGLLHAYYMWKLFTGMIGEEMYIYLERGTLLPEEQKGCRRRCRGTNNKLLIDKTILRDCKKRRINLAMAWIDYKKAYDFMLHSGIIECMDMAGNADNMISFIHSGCFL